MLRNIVNAVCEEPRTVAAYTATFATLGTGLGLLAAEDNRQSMQNCAYGDYILDNADKFNCTASGSPCTDWDGYPNPNPLVLDCSYQNQSKLVIEAARTFARSFAWTPDAKLFYIVAPIVGFVSGSILGFGLGVLHVSSNRNTLFAPKVITDNEKTPLLPTTRSLRSSNY